MWLLNRPKAQLLARENAGTRIKSNWPSHCVTRKCSVMKVLHGMKNLHVMKVLHGLMHYILLPTIIIPHCYQQPVWYLPPVQAVGHIEVK
jgi:hypothetical protein